MENNLDFSFELSSFNTPLRARPFVFREPIILHPTRAAIASHRPKLRGFGLLPTPVIPGRAKREPGIHFIPCA
jgi:hypothetical protein